MGRRIYLIVTPAGEFVSSPTNTTTTNINHAVSFNPDSEVDMRQALQLAAHHGGELKLYERERDTWRLREVS